MLHHVDSMNQTHFLADKRVVFAKAIFCVFCVSLVSSHSAWAGVTAEGSNKVCVELQSNTLFSRAESTFTFAEFDALFVSRVPPEDRVEFLQSPDRLSRTLDALYLNNVFLNRPSAQEILDDPGFQAELYNTIGRAVRNKVVAKKIQDALLSDYEAAAREIFLNDRDRFIRRQAVDFSHVLIPVGGVGEELTALEAAHEVSDLMAASVDFQRIMDFAQSHAQVRIEAEALFEQVEMEQLLPELRREVREMEEGDWLGPVRTEHGWHFVRLIKRHEVERLSWEEARPHAEEIARSRHRESVEERIIQDLLDEPIDIVEGGIRELLSRYGASWSDDIGSAFN